MPKIKLVTKDEDGTYGFRCAYPTGCGQPGGDAFTSLGWGRREDAAARGQQHLDEHADGKPMPTLDEFRTERGLTRENAGRPDPTNWEL